MRFLRKAQKYLWHIVIGESRTLARQTVARWTDARWTLARIGLARAFTLIIVYCEHVSHGQVSSEHLSDEQLSDEQVSVSRHRYPRKIFSPIGQNLIGSSDVRMKTCRKSKLPKTIFSSNSCLVILDALSVVKISAQSALPSSSSRNCQKREERVPLRMFDHLHLNNSSKSFELYFHHSMVKEN